MGERILIISDKKKDLDLLEKILGPKGFDLEGISLFDQIEEVIIKDGFDAVLADYDLIGERAYDWLRLLQENRAKSCFILYGKGITADNISEILQKGAYGFVPRTVLSERIYDTIVGGLENRKAFIEILGMIDELRDVNERLEREKEALRTRNQEADFINRLSSKVAYDLNWDRIIPRILDAGLLNVIDLDLLGILYRIGSNWGLAIHLSEKKISEERLERLKEDIVKSFFSLSKKRISKGRIILYLYPSNAKGSPSSPICISKEWTRPLSLAGKILGMLVVLPKTEGGPGKREKGLLSTISNILAMSLKNAQEYHRVKEMAVTDALTGIYNHKGFKDLIKREFQRAVRYNKALSLIMIDVDGFKTINDSLGHQAGDYVLKDLAGCLRRSVRKPDIVARYGGDEFVVLLPETEPEEAEGLAKRVAETVKNHAFEYGSERLEVEISYGVSSLGELENGEGERELIQMADSRLYYAKRSRNLLY